MEHLAAQGASPDPARAADGLIAEFGSLSAALAGARSRQLAAAGGDEHAVDALRSFRRIMLHALRQEVGTRPVLSDARTLATYLRADMAHSRHENVRVLYLDVRNGLLSDELAGLGTIDAAPLHTRHIVARAIELGAAGLILAHNHPAGDPSPSRADVSSTRALVATCRGLDIEVHDHLIVTRSTITSLRALGLLAA